MRFLALTSLVFLSGCWNFEAAWNKAYDSGTPDSSPDSGVPDSGTEVDAGTPDSGTVDSGTPDAGPPICVGGCGTSQACVDGVCRDPVALTAGEDFTCALLDGGSVWCWGANTYGQLGTDAGTAVFPARVPGLPSATQISAGLHHVCAVTGDSAGIWCWGDDSNSATGHAGRQVAPISNPLGNTQAQVAAGYSHSCAIDLAGALRCWGDNSTLQLGADLGAGPFEAPTLVAANGYASVSAGDGFSCAVTTNSDVKCWGKGGALGYGTLDGGLPGTVVQSSSGDPLYVTEVCAGGNFACGLSNGFAGILRCWGNNTYHQIPDDSASDPSLWPATDGYGFARHSLFCGARHACSMRTYTNDSPDVNCWGDNGARALGVSDNTASLTASSAGPVALPVGSIPESVAAGSTHSCALTTEHKIYCWGSVTGGFNPTKVNFAP